MRQYWVVGGEFTDTSFNAYAPGRSEERYGPFAAYPEAYKEWQARARATMDFATVRYRIVTSQKGEEPGGAGAAHSVEAVAFDIIETMFSTDALQPHVIALGLPPAAVDQIYTQASRDSMALACTGSFAPFTELLAAALQEMLARRGLDPHMAATLDWAEVMSGLEPQPDARAAIQHLAEAEIPTYAITNGSAEATKTLLKRAGLEKLFAGVFAAEAVSLAKPRPEIYVHAAHEIGAEPRSIMLIATHPWDVHGAMDVGMQGGFVARGKPYPAFMHQPTACAESLLEIVRLLT